MIDATLRWALETPLSPGAMGAFIPVLYRSGRPDEARTFARHLLPDLTSLDSFELAAVIRGWTAAREDLPEVRSALRSAFARLSESTGDFANEVTLLAAAECLGEPFEIRLGAPLAALRQRNDFRSMGLSSLEFGRLQDALLDLGEEDLARSGMASLELGPAGGVPGMPGVPWVSSAGQAVCAKVWSRLGMFQEADRALDFLLSLRNPSGGFFSSYGVRAGKDAARESEWAALHFLEASLVRDRLPLSVNPALAGLVQANSNLHQFALRSPSYPYRGKVLLVVCLFEGNFGDILIFQTIQDKLRAAGFSTETVEVSQPLGQSRMIERANDADFLYFVGGGLIERWAPEVIRHFDLVFPHLRVPYGVIGLSTGSFDYRSFAPSIKLFSEQAAFFFTRDEESVESFRTAGASRLPLPSADVVFAHPAFREGAGGGEVSASFRNVPYVDVTGDLDWDAWGAALRQIGVRSLIGDCSDAQARLALPLSERSVLDSLASSSAVVAMRFHVLLVAARMGVPVIPIAYCPKVGRLAQQLGLGDYCLGLHEPHRLPEVFERLQRDRERIRAELRSRVALLQQQAEAAIQASISTILEKINGR